MPVLNNVRYASDSDHSRYESELTLWAISGLMHCTKSHLYSSNSSARCIAGSSNPVARAPCRLALGDVRFGSKADIGLLPVDVRYSPKSGHRAAHSIISADSRLALDGAYICAPTPEAMDDEATSETRLSKAVRSSPPRRSSGHRLNGRPMTASMPSPIG